MSDKHITQTAPTQAYFYSMHGGLPERKELTYHGPSQGCLVLAVADAVSYF